MLSARVDAVLIDLLLWYDGIPSFCAVCATCHHVIVINPTHEHESQGEWVRLGLEAKDAVNPEAYAPQTAALVKLLEDAEAHMTCDSC
jgi:hypothetical protein